MEVPHGEYTINVENNFHKFVVNGEQSELALDIVNKYFLVEF